MVKVALKYRGHFRSRAGKDEENLEVPQDAVKAKDRILEMVETSYGIKPPVVLMIDGVHIAKILKTPESYPLRDGMEIILLPSISGG